MDVLNQILRALGRIEGRLDKMDSLDQRVGQLEIWQAWLKGGWATLATGYVYLCTVIYGK